MRRWFLIYLLLLPFIYPTPTFAEPSLTVSFKPDNIKQGDILFIIVKADSGIDKISGVIFDKPIRFYAESGKDYYSALVGIDMETEAGRYPLSLYLNYG